VDRRKLLGAVAALGAAPLGAQPRAPRVVGLLTLSDPRHAAPAMEGFVRRLESLGHKPGKHIAFEPRFAETQVARLAPLARELLALQPAVVIASGNGPARALLQQTRTTPIVLYGSDVPVAAGLVASLSRPGGNVTGTTYVPREFAAKMLEVLKIAAPRVSRVTIVGNPDLPGMNEFKEPLDRAAARLKVALTSFPLNDTMSFDGSALARSRPEGLMVSSLPSIRAHAPRLIEHALAARIPVIGASRQFVPLGTTLAFAPDTAEMMDSTVEMVDRILQGANPADMPVREPTRFELIVSRKAAQAIGLPLPRELLVLATDVID
jgi:putative tryptophan/tyrosine transport system substrate-binding protein